jgi:hypothetical protein
VRMLGAIGTETFNSLLARWRREGRPLGWPELQEAYRAAQAAEEAAAEAKEQAERQARKEGPHESM